MGTVCSRSSTSTVCTTPSISLTPSSLCRRTITGACARGMTLNTGGRLDSDVLYRLTTEKDSRMRMLIWHVDEFVVEATERGRSKLADETPQAVRVGEALVVFAASEKADESEPEAVAERAVAALGDVARRLGER